MLMSSMSLSPPPRGFLSYFGCHDSNPICSYMISEPEGRESRFQCEFYPVSSVSCFLTFLYRCSSLLVTWLSVFSCFPYVTQTSSGSDFARETNNGTHVASYVLLYTVPLSPFAGGPVSLPVFASPFSFLPCSTSSSFSCPSSCFSFFCSCFAPI